MKAGNSKFGRIAPCLFGINLSEAAKLRFKTWRDDKQMTNSSWLCTKKDVFVAFTEEMCNTKFTTQFCGNSDIRNASNCQWSFKRRRKELYNKSAK